MLSLSPDKILVVVLFFVVPGFVANRVFALKCPSPKPDWEKVVIEFGAYSLLNALIWYHWVSQYLFQPVEDWTPWKLTVNGLLICFISPTVMALVWVKLRVLFHHRLGIDHPTPRGWDHFLKNSGGNFFVIFTLKGGKKIGGYFAGKSLASMYPQEPELYVEELWRVDEHGKFIEPVAGSAGAVVRQSDWELIEFMKVETEATDGRDGTQGILGEGQGGTDHGADRDGGAGGSIPTGANGQAAGQDHPPARGVGDGTAPGPAETQDVRTEHGEQ